jgi:hypothetical protein
MSGHLHTTSLPFTRRGSPVIPTSITRPLSSPQLRGTIQTQVSVDCPEFATSKRAS